MADTPARYVSRGDMVQVSQHADPDAVWSRFFALVEGDRSEPDPLNRLDWFDPLDPRFTRAVAATVSLGPHIYQGEPITTVAHQWYNKTSPWFLIVLYNGFVHADEIPGGTELQIPSLDSFKTEWNRVRQQAARTVVF